jgi:DNA repair exonuclease SbcCD nuclease subunit
MRILVIGDSHFENKNEIESEMMCDRIYDIVLKQRPDIIVNLGDTCHNHNILHMGPLKRATQFLHRLSQLSTHLFVIIGNHDRPNNTAFLTEDSPFVACKMWTNTTVVDKVKTYEFISLNDKKIKLAFVPYVPNGRFMEALATENITNENINEYSVIFAHQEFKGCKMGAIVSVHGDEWSLNNPLVISGHIHDNQVLQPNIIYPGTPIQLGYGVPPSKGVMMLNISSTEDVDSLNRITHEYFDLGLPKKMIVYLTPSELSKYEVPENCFVKLVCRGDTKVIKDIIKLDSVKEMLNNPRVKLSIQESKTKNSILESVDINLSTDKTETIPFQKRLFDVVKTQSAEIQSIFTLMFGKV